jgi:hypothetical protein
MIELVDWTPKSPKYILEYVEETYQKGGATYPHWNPTL